MFFVTDKELTQTLFSVLFAYSENIDLCAYLFVLGDHRNVVDKDPVQSAVSGADVSTSCKGRFAFQTVGNQPEILRLCWSDDWQRDDYSSH